jgi:hypothetical protein
MKRRKYILIFGAALTTLLLISSATAVNFSNDGTTEEETPPGNWGVEEGQLPGNDEAEEEPPDNDAYVDPNIELTTTLHLSQLEILVNKIDDAEFKIFTQELINELKKDGVVTAQDVREILGRHEFLASSSVYRGPISGTAGNKAKAFGFPLRFHILYVLISTQVWYSWPGPGLGVWWSCTEGYKDIHITVGGDEITGYHKGMAFFQFGLWEYTGKASSTWYLSEWYFSINARSPLILIKPS